MTTDPTTRTLTARIAAHESWATTSDRSKRTAAARTALLERFFHEVDPDGTLPEAERQRRAEHARSAYYTRLALRSHQARGHQVKAEAEAEAVRAEAEALGIEL